MSGQNGKEIESCLDQVQELSNLLTVIPDLDTALEESLSYILNAINRESGSILIHSFSNPAPVLIISEELTNQWTVQLNDKYSDLRDLARETQRQGIKQEADPTLSLAGAFPFIIDESSLGVLLLHGKPADDQEIQHLKHLNQVVARRILQDQYEKKSKQPNQDLAAILMTSAQVNKGLDPSQLQARLMRIIYRFFQVEQGALILTDEDDPNLAIVKTLRNDAEWNYQVYLNHQTSILGTCIQEGETLTVNNLEMHPSFNPNVDLIREADVRNMICSPLIIDDQVKGALVLYNKNDGMFDAYDKRLISTIARLISFTIYDIDLVQRLQIASAELEVNRWQLLQSRNTLRALFDNIPLSMYIIDSRYNLAAINLSRSKRVGSKPSELVGKKCYQALYGKSEPCSSCLVDQTLFGGESTSRVAKEFLQDLSFLEWEITTYPILDENDQVRQAILIEEEITEKKRLEEHMIQSEKLAVVGQLAAGVAHEINNPLTAIVANTQLLRREYSDDQEMLEALELIEHAGDRAAKVVGNLLNLARKDQYDYQNGDLNALISESLNLLQHEIKAHGIKLIFHPDDELPYLQLNKESIKGVWTNIILNGIDAQKEQEGGEIQIKTSADGEYVYVSIRDRGPGIEPEKLKRIFEPFYTTKVAGEGTGLGLTICQRVVKQHGGQIKVESEIDKGTEFIIQLPHSS